MKTFLFLLSLNVACTLSYPATGSLGIYDGKTTTIENFPYIVAIFDEDNFLCAGTIVSENWILTTANCINKTSDVASLRILAGSDDLLTGSYYLVNQTVQHHNYNSKTLDYVYSLVQINGTFTWSASVKAALLPTSNPCSFSTVSVVGYGATKASSSSESGQLMEGTMRWWPKTFCKSMVFTSNIDLTDRTACGYNAGHTTLCSGDLADPFLKDGVLYGMFAYSQSTMACTASAFPVLLADILPVTQWISSITQATFQHD